VAPRLLFHSRRIEVRLVLALVGLGALTSGCESQSTEALVARLGDPDVRLETQRRLVERGEEAVPLLVALLADSRAGAQRRSAAVFVLKEIGAPAMPALLELVREGDASSGEAAALVLGRLGAAAVEPLIEVLQEGSEISRENASSALVAIHGPAVRPVAQLLNNAPPVVRLAAAGILLRISISAGGDALRVLRSLERDEDPAVRELARVAFERDPREDVTLAEEAHGGKGGEDIPGER